MKICGANLPPPAWLGLSLTQLQPQFVLLFISFFIKVQNNKNKFGTHSPTNKKLVEGFNSIKKLKFIMYAILRPRNTSTWPLPPPHIIPRDDVGYGSVNRNKNSYLEHSVFNNSVMPYYLTYFLAMCLLQSVLTF